MGVLDNHTFVTFMVVALAALGLVMGYAIFYRFMPDSGPGEQSGEAKQEQGVYMREVRLRYQGAMAYSNGYGRKW